MLLQLPSDEVERLDVVRALVDREDLGVAAVLLDAVVANVPRPAQRLNRQLMIGGGQ